VGRMGPRGSAGGAALPAAVVACYHPSRVTIGRKSAAKRGRKVLDRVRVPCGHCLGCRTDQARGWAVRLVHEGQVTSPAWMVTLTYAPEKLPEFGSLRPRDPTLFFKRAREASPYGFSYYLCGEYGDRTSRPHYHACLFGVPFHDREYLLSRHDAPVYRSDSLDAWWKHGLCEFTGLTYGAARYVAAYVRKKVRQRDAPEHYERVDPATGEVVLLEREYGRMSRRPAIGRRWIERYWRDVYPRDFVVMDGRELKPPRYYDKWMSQGHSVDSPCGGSCLEHVQLFQDVQEQRYRDMVEIGDEKLEMKEKVHRAKVALFQQRGSV